ncbi:translation initiation factor IF-2-like [Camelus ferus]|uniref:Translation initiation factor IF-2-like n=1 Tax=Camelus ferus TaxID=419612 RepID=A0A8B8T2V5_CAMFR|nr:translation initiation factor IF-2-like [Camelus ferus]
MEELGARSGWATIKPVAGLDSGADCGQCKTLTLLYLPDGENVLKAALADSGGLSVSSSFEVSLLGAAGVVRKLEEVSGSYGSGRASKVDASANRSISSHRPLSWPRGGLCYPRCAGLSCPCQPGPRKLSSCLATGRPPLTQVRRTKAFEVSLLLGAGEGRTGEVVSGRYGGSPERKRDASASRSFSYRPTSPGLGAASATPGVRQLILLVSQVLGGCPGEPKGHGRRGERTASGEPISLLPSPQAPGLGAASPAPGSEYASFQLSQPTRGRRGVIRVCIEKSGLTHRARVYVQISLLAGPGVGLYYPRSTRCSSLCFPGPGKRVRGGQGAGRGRGGGGAGAATERAEAGCTGCPGKPADFHPVFPWACNEGALCCFRVAIGIPPGGSNTGRLPPSPPLLASGRPLLPQVCGIELSLSARS